jgi:hypothetical protein
MAMSLTANATATRVLATSVRKSHVNLTHYKPRSVSRAAAKLAEGSVEEMGIATVMAIHPGSGAQTVLGWALAWGSAAAAAEIPFLTSVFALQRAGGSNIIRDLLEPEPALRSFPPGSHCEHLGRNTKRWAVAHFFFDESISINDQNFRGR